MNDNNGGNSRNNNSDSNNDISKPHDSFWRKMMQYPKVAQEFFAMHLPMDIKKGVRLNTIKLQPDSFVENNLSTQTTDLLYSVQFKQQAGYIYTLIEHQSSPDKTMPFRLLKYMVAIMDRHLKQHKNGCLPVIYPLVVYTGTTPYNYSTDIYDLFGDNKGLAKSTFLKPHQLVSYKQIKDHELEKFLYYGIIVKTMRHIYDADFLLPLQEVIMPYLKIVANLGEKDYIYTTLRYAFRVGAISDEQKFIDIVQKGLTREFGEHVMTAAERFEQRGIQKGKQEGKQEATSKIAKNLLHQGLPTKQVALATGLSVTQIKALQK